MNKYFKAAKTRLFLTLEASKDACSKETKVNDKGVRKTVTEAAVGIAKNKLRIQNQTKVQNKGIGKSEDFI